MAISLTASGLVYPDGSTRADKFDTSADKGALVATSYFTAASSTWTKAAGVNYIRVLVQGGGGGGVGHGECGGAGGFAEKWIDVSTWATGTTVAVTVGTAGAATTYNNQAASGTSSSFGAYATATGGYGGNRNYNHTGGHGGLGSGGDINLYGGGGGGHNGQAGAKGGNSYFGGGAGSSHHNVPVHYYESHVPYGAGGTGSWTSHTRGSNGQPGIVIVYNYK